MGVLDGVKVVEVAEHGFVPSAAAILAEWGADVVKVERPTGDPLRQIMSMGFVADTGDFNFLFEQFNRNKRGVAIDLRTDDGRAALDRLIEWADVYITNFLPSARDKLRLDPDDIWAVNPRCVYAIGSGQGLEGPDADQGGFDAVSYWARGGLAHMLTPQGAPLVQPRGALGDAPERRVPRGRRRGRAVPARAHRRADRRRRVAARRRGVDAVERPRARRRSSARTAAPRRGQEPRQRARRFVPHRRRTLAEPEHARPRTALGADVPRARPRRADRQARVRDRRAARRARRRSCIRSSSERIASLPLAELKERLSAQDTIYSAIASPVEVIDDPQVIANGYLAPHPDHDAGAARRRRRCSSTGRASRSGAARPAIGEHTDEVFRELGVDDAEIDAAARDRGVSYEVGVSPTRA